MSGSHPVPPRRCQLYGNQIYNPSSADRNASNNGPGQIIHMQELIVAELNEFCNNRTSALALKFTRNFLYMTSLRRKMEREKDSGVSTRGGKRWLNLN